MIIKALEAALIALLTPATDFIWQQVLPLENVETLAQSVGHCMVRLVITV